VEADAATVKRQKRALSALVAERNRLIHQDLAGFDHNSTASCRGLISMLDEQNTRVLSQLEELATLIAEFKSHVDALKGWAEGDGPNMLVQRPSHDA
jgi:phage shock protein A